MPEKKRGIAVGLTGNISSGKTTVMHLFDALGCKILSTDELGHELLEYSPDVKKEIIASFGESVTDINGKVDRSKLANIVFQDNEKRRELEHILHPQIQQAAKREIDNLPVGRIMIIEAPLLFESHWEDNVDYSIMVACPIEIRKKRFYESGIRKPGDFERRDKAQWTEDHKKKLSTFIIDNSSDILHVKAQVKQVLKKLLQK